MTKTDIQEEQAQTLVDEVRAITKGNPYDIKPEELMQYMLDNSLSDSLVAFSEMVELKKGETLTDAQRKVLTYLKQAWQVQKAWKPNYGGIEVNVQIAKMLQKEELK